MAKKRPKFNQEMAIRGVNRRLFARSPLVREKLEESRQEFPKFKKDGSRAKKDWVRRQCESCLEWVGSTKISVDHRDPVVPPEGFPPSYDMWDRITVFLKRLWCDKSNLQRLCDTCHNKKTQEERIARLLKQYTEELDQIEKTIQVMGGLKNLLEAGGITKKSLIKDLSKYTAKKKTVGLESVVQRALILKNGLKNK
jgi:hypothetical protein